MLKSLHIRNFILIDSVEIEFFPGLNIISGETGTGKSIIVQAISALMGASIPSPTRRDRSKPIIFEGYFHPDVSVRIGKQLEHLQLEVEKEDEVVIRREILKNGRSRYLINDALVSRKDFQAISRQLLDVNSQLEYQSLLRPGNYLAILDRTLHLDSAVRNVSDLYGKLIARTQRLQQVHAEIKSMREKEQLYRYQIEEIAQANLQSGEKDRTVAEFTRLRYAEEIRSLLEQVLEIGGAGDHSASEQIRKIYGLLRKAALKDLEINPLFETIDSISLTFEDFLARVEQHVRQVDWSKDRLRAVQERLHFLQDMELKYKDSIDGIIGYAAKIEAKLEEFRNRRVDLRTLESKWKEALDRYLQATDKLSRKRHRLIPALEKRIEKTLAKLGFNSAAFHIVLKTRQPEQELPVGVVPAYFSAFGLDSADFLLSANPGNPALPIAKIASGGELSRIMLALKRHFIADENFTVIFDEIDAGIGGKTALAVADQVKELAVSRQIICITHLAQLAARADHHIRVSKMIRDRTTEVRIVSLAEQDRVREIARMLAGKVDDSHAQELARALMEEK